MRPSVELDPRVALHALEQSTSAIVFLDKSKKIIFYNAAAEHLVGVNRNEMLGADVSMLLNKTFARLLDHPIYNFLKCDQDSEKLMSFEGEVIRLDGTVFLANIRISKVSQGNEHYHSILISDVSKRQKMEEDILSKNAQLGKLNDQMEKFLYATSHDLRSPLTSIMGLINLMRMESIDETTVQYINKIESSTIKLDRIIRNIMSFSKATYQPMRSEKIDLEYLTHRVLNAHQTDPNYKRIHFEIVCNQNTLFHSDPERLEIALNNLISNAIRFFDANKMRSFVRINISVTEHEALIEIIDNGVGIGKQHHDQIFSMFYKATLNASGAGLGLYIVKESIEQLKGSITMESELGFGSVFRMKVPNGSKGQMTGRKQKVQRQ